jgi:hypothetical protein
MATRFVQRAGVASVVLLAACVVGSALAAPAPKLYRWVGADGKPYYSDQVPPEAMDKARQELSVKSGMAIGQVDRALTPEERAAAAAKAVADAQTAKTQEDVAKNDQALLTSYPTEVDLKRAYDERVVLQAETIKATRIGIESQQQNLSSQLISASNFELTGKPVTPKLVDSIQLARKQLLDLQALLVRHTAASTALQNEYQSTLEHYRSLQSGGATRSAPAPAPGGAPPNG